MQDILSNPKLTGSLASAGIIMVGLFTCAACVEDDNKDPFINVVVLFVGWGFGWLIGTFLSPYTKEEQQQFMGYAGVVSTFLSGYAIGKVDRLITHIFTPTNFFAIERITGFRILIFSGSFLVATLITFLFRKYF